ncbi:helix-turn-helix domain-containing protein [Terriglobus tenax]|uniref:helix-turn-helix domain-containing protein n=1 Tax=Terriglobus tenax TaxID=1111115 RepID=UPI0037DA5EA2
MDHNFHLTHLQRIESGKGLSIPTLLRVAEALNVSAADLIDGLGMCADIEQGATGGKDCK